MALPTTTASLLTFSNDHGASALDLITYEPNQVISGTLSAALAQDETVWLSLNDGGTWVQATALNTSFSLGAVLRTGSNTVQVRVANADGAGPESAFAYTLDAQAPAVSGTVSIPAHGVYSAGHPLTFDVAFDEDVTLIGTGSTLELDIGGAARSAAYQSKLGNTITYAYTVQAGDNDANGITIGAIALGGSTLRDTAGNNAILSLSGHLPSTAGVKIDAAAPQISSVGVPADGAYGVGQTLYFTVNFDEDISVSGQGSLLSLNVGGTSRSATYFDKTNDSITYSYTVQAGDIDANGIAITGLSLNGSTIRDIGANPADLSLAGRIPSTTGVLIDGQAPTAKGLTIKFSSDTGLSATDLITRTAAQVVSGTLSEALGTGERVEVSFNGGSNWITAPSSGVDWSLSGVTLGGFGVLQVRVVDAAGNAGEIYSRDWRHDVTAPTQTAGAFLFSQDTGVSSTDRITKSTAQDLTGVISSSLDASEYVEVSLDNGDSWTTASTSGTTWSLNGVTLSGSNTLGVRVSDLAGNIGTTTLMPYALDTTAPTVSGSLAVPADATYVVGQSLDFTVAFSEAITVNGADSALGLTVGATARSAAFLSSSANTVTYRYTVQAGDRDANGIAVNGITLGASTIRDIAGNDAVLSLSGHVPSTSGVLINGVAPSVAGMISVPNSGDYVVGETLNFTVTFDENVTITGADSTLGLTIGATARSATYLSKTANSVTYSYTVQAGDLDTDGISISGVSLGSSTIRDAAGVNNANLSLAGHLPSTAGIRIDTLAPAVVITSNVSTLKADETAIITFTFSEQPSGFVAGDIAVSGGSLSPLTGSGLVYTAVFTPTAGVDSGAAAITIGAGDYQDAAGNNGSPGVTPALTFDTARPTVAITASNTTPNVGDSTALTFTFSETVSGFSIADLVVSGGTLSGLAATADPKVYTAVFTISGSGSASVQVAAGAFVDTAGNSGLASSLSLTVPAPQPQPEPEPQPEFSAPEIRENFAVAAGFAPDSPKALTSIITLADGTVAPNPAFETAVKLAALLARFEAGIMTKDELIDGVVELSAPTSGVALSAYQFFTGSTPTQAGMAWLIDSPDNANDLTDPYYARFNEVNRFINFAVNLGTQGEGAAAFEARFEGLDFAAAVRTAYDMVIGLDAARAAGIDVDAALSWVASQEGYFDAFAGSDLGGKAAMVGYLMQAGFEAKVGRYYEAAHGFIEDSFDGTPAYQVDLVGGQHLGAI